MGKNKKIKGGGLVYSTNKELMSDLFSGIKLGSDGGNDTDAIENTIEDKVRVWLDKKNRGGKEVSVIRGISAPDEQLKTLAKELKTKCGVGGSVKDGEIIIQGNHRDKIITILSKKGYSDVKKAGG